MENDFKSFLKLEKLTHKKLAHQNFAFSSHFHCMLTTIL